MKVHIKFLIDKINWEHREQGYFITSLYSGINHFNLCVCVGGGGILSFHDHQVSKILFDKCTY